MRFLVKATECNDFPPDNTHFELEWSDGTIEKLFYLDLQDRLDKVKYINEEIADTYSINKLNAASIIS